MNEQKPTLEQLKAIAYDTIGEIQRLSNNLEQVSKAIREYKVEPEVVVGEGKEE